MFLTWRCCCCLYVCFTQYVLLLIHECKVMVAPRKEFTCPPHSCFLPHTQSLISPYSTTLQGSVPTLQPVVTNIHTSNQTMKLSMCQTCLWVSWYYSTFPKPGRTEDVKGREKRREKGWEKREGMKDGKDGHTGCCGKPVPVAKQHTMHVAHAVCICTNLK